MDTFKIISKCGAALAIFCIIFLPFVGCGDQHLSGLDVITTNGIDAIIKVFVVIAIICGVLIFIFNKPVVSAALAIGGLVSLLIAYLIAHGKNGSIELKYGAFLAILGYAVTSVVNFLGISQKSQKSA